MDPKYVGKFLADARVSQGFTQEQLARAAGLRQSVISKMETGQRLPSLPQLMKLARILIVPVQWFLTGTTVAGDELRDISMQLRALGIADLEVTNERVPGSFRYDEQVMALALCGNAPPARIIEAMPTVMAWNVRSPLALEIFAKIWPGLLYRLAWLADIAVTIHENQGFPGGCPALVNLEIFLNTAKREWAEQKPPPEEQQLGFGFDVPQRPPVSSRWKILYPAPLASFRERAERLNAMLAEKRFRVLSAL
jgi:transcriptional regulator with XRE-family HTH domain